MESQDVQTGGKGVSWILSAYRRTSEAHYSPTSLNHFTEYHPLRLPSIAPQRDLTPLYERNSVNVTRKIVLPFVTCFAVSGCRLLNRGLLFKVNKIYSKQIKHSDRILLKLEKIWIGITSRIVTFDRWIQDRWKHDTLPFKTLFELFRYDFRFPRYYRLKKVAFQIFTWTPIISY